MDLFIEKFSSESDNKWDNFIEQNSVNGTFFHSIKFLNYHKDRFNDYSLIIKKSENFVALIPSCEVIEDNKKIFYSHKGSTFGGIVINNKFNTLNHIDNVINILK